MADVVAAPNPAPAAEQKPAAPAPKTEAKVVKPTTPAAKAPEQTITIKIDGKLQTLPLSVAQARLQKTEAADRRLQEATQTKAQAEAIMKQFESDPEGALKKMGKDPEKFINDFLARKARESQMTPEQLEAERLKAQLAEYQHRENADKAEKAKLAQEAMDQRVADNLAVQFTQIAQANGLPGNPKTLALMADVALEALEAEINITPEQLASEVKYRLQNDRVDVAKAHLTDLTDDQALVEFLGPELISRIAKLSLGQIPSKAKPAAKQAQNQIADDGSPVAKPKKGYLTEKEVNEQMMGAAGALGRTAMAARDITKKGR